MYRGVQRENNNDNKNVFPNFRNLHGQCQLILGEKNIQVCSLERSYTLPSNDNIGTSKNTLNDIQIAIYQELLANFNQTYN